MKPYNKILICPNGKDSIETSIVLPASKSISNRAIILNELAYSPYPIGNLSDSDDTQVMLDVFASNDHHFDIGAAGTSMRFLTAFLSKTVGEWSITGSERMKQRPIKILVDAIREIGGKIDYIEKDGFPPLRIFGCGLKGGNIKLDGSVSSQYISALMMIAPYTIDGLTIQLTGEVISKPYIEMTQAMMNTYGVKVDFCNQIIHIAPQTYQPTPYTVEGDWSAASYWYEILALHQQGKIVLKGLSKKSLQGDREIATIFRQFGIETTYQEGAAIIQKKSGGSIKKEVEEVFQYDFTKVPDLAQTVVVTCCLLDRPFYFTGLQSLRIKETNRIAALCQELKKLGFVLREKGDDTLYWERERCQQETQPTIATYEDHRMAMAFAPVGILTPLHIAHPSVVSKSYPSFWSDFEKIGNIKK